MKEVAKFLHYETGRNCVEPNFRQTLVENNKALLPLFKGEAVKLNVKERQDGKKQVSDWHIDKLEFKAQFKIQLMITGIVSVC